MELLSQQNLQPSHPQWYDHSGTNMRFYPQRPSGQAVVTGVVPSIPRYVAHEEDATLRFNYKGISTVIKQGTGSSSAMEEHSNIRIPGWNVMTICCHVGDHVVKDLHS